MKVSKDTSEDIYHVAVPLIVALMIASTSLGGSAIFLVTWGAARAIQAI